MPKTSAVRFFMDEKSGKMVVMDRDGIRVMSEVGAGAKRGRKPKDPLAPTDPPADGEAPKKRGRPKKAKAEKE